MVPERHAWPLALDEALHRLRLVLGGGAGPTRRRRPAAASGRGSCGSGPRRWRCGACPPRCRRDWRRPRARARSTRRPRPPGAHHRPAACSLPWTAPTTRFTRARAAHDTRGSAGPAPSGRSSPAQAGGRGPRGRRRGRPCRRRKQRAPPARVWRPALGSAARDRGASRARRRGRADCNRHGVRVRAPLQALLCLAQVAVPDPGAEGGVRTEVLDPLEGDARLLPRSRACSPTPRSRS